MYDLFQKKMCLVFFALGGKTFVKVKCCSEETPQ